MSAYLTLFFSVSIVECGTNGGAELGVFWYVELYTVQLFGGREHAVAQGQKGEVANHDKLFDA